MLLVFFGFARVATPLIPRLSSFMSPIARWSVFALNVVVWPFFTFPYWCLRYAFWGPGAGWKRVLAFFVGAWNLILLVIVVLMAIRKLLTSWRPEWPADFPGVIPDGRVDPRRRGHTRVLADQAVALVGGQVTAEMAPIANFVIRAGAATGYDDPALAVSTARKIRESGQTDLPARRCSA